MRLSVVGRSALVLVAVAASACDSRTITGSASSGRVQIAIPWLGGVGSTARQTATSSYDVVSVRVTIRIPRAGTPLLDKAFTASDGVFTFYDPPVNDVAASGAVEFPVPAGAGSETFEFYLEASNAAGVVLYKIGPISFRLGADGQSATIEERPLYVGPNSGVTSVLIQPRSITVVAGQTQAISCLGNPGGVSDFAHTFDSDNTSIAFVENFNAVRGVTPGTTRITCEMDWGTHATDAINVVVTAPPAPVASVAVTPNPGSVSVGNTLPMQAVTRDAANNVLTGRTVTWATSNFAVATVGLTTGVVTGVTAGSVTITATSEGKSGTATVTVTAAPTTGGVSGVVQNASNGLPQSGATVEVRAGSATTGTPIATATTPANGSFSFPTLASGAYTILAVATGFAPVSVSVTIIAGQNQTVTIALPPVSDTGISIILTWGASPDDLDSYLHYPNGTQPIAYFNRGSCSSSPFACLINDETSPNSSEYVYINQIPVQGTYTFRVNDYDNTCVFGALGSSALAGSHARVDVLVNGVTRNTFTVPNQAGVTWTVFTLTGSLASPTITAVNTMQAAPPPGLGCLAAARGLTPPAIRKKY